jgi:hypothetical protein
MPGDQRTEHSFPPGLQRGKSAGLVSRHQTAVADHISGQDGREAALDAFFGHRMLPLENAVLGLYGGFNRESIGPGWDQLDVAPP